jgi:hypothetical protein
MLNKFHFLEPLATSATQISRTSPQTSKHAPKMTAAKIVLILHV